MNEFNRLYLRNRVLGCLLGVAIGDALGMPLEFLKDDQIDKEFGRVTEFLSPKNHEWNKHRKPGQWTDDWYFTKLVCTSLINEGRIDLDDLANSHAEAYPNLRKIGGGEATRFSLRKLAKNCDWKNSGKPGAEGNGVVMKVTPIGLMLGISAQPIYRTFNLPYICLEKSDIEKIAFFAGMTHDSPVARITAAMHVAGIAACLMRESKFEKIFKNSVFSACLLASKGLRVKLEDKDDLYGRFYMIFGEEPYKKMTVREYADYLGVDDGRVTFTLPFCYGAFLRNPTSIETLYDVVNCGGDTDTNGSIVGGLLGAYNGFEIFPEHLVKGLYENEELAMLARIFSEKFIR